MRTPPRFSRPDLIDRDRTIMLAVAAGAAVLCALAQIAVYAAGTPARGDGAGAELVLNLVLDASLPLVVRLPRTVGGLAVAVTTVSAVPLVPGVVTPVNGPTHAPMAAAIVVSFLTYLLPWRQALVFAAVLGMSALPVWAPTWGRLALALSATALPALVALYVRTRVELVRALRRRAELADSERRLLAERAETAERQRLAAEMHDIVTHHVTEIALHADALRVTARDDDTRSAAEQIRRSATRTLTELRDLIRVVTTGTAAAPVHRDEKDTGDEDTGGDLAALAAADGAALHVEGDPGTVPAVVARAVYRVVQEALTNARKHAPGAPVTIDIAYPGDRAEVEVRNAPPQRGGDPTLTGTGSGIGLTGLNRRITMLGGTFHAASDDHGGFTVTATIPAVSERAAGNSAGHRA